MDPWRDKCSKIKINCIPLDLLNHLPGVEKSHIEKLLKLKDIGLFPLTPDILFTSFSPLYSEREILNIFSFDESVNHAVDFYSNSADIHNYSSSGNVDTRTAFGS